VLTGGLYGFAFYRRGLEQRGKYGIKLLFFDDDFLLHNYAILLPL
jgi:hypothetical protein